MTLIFPVQRHFININDVTWINAKWACLCVSVQYTIGCIGHLHTNMHLPHTKTHQYMHTHGDVCIHAYTNTTIHTCVHGLERKPHAHMHAHLKAPPYVVGHSCRHPTTYGGRVFCSGSSHLMGKDKGAEYWCGPPGNGYYCGEPDRTGGAVLCVSL